MAKRATAATKPLTAKCPVWLRLEKATGKFAQVPDRVRVVRRIFDFIEQGISLTAIAKILNVEQEPSPQPNTAWTRHSVGTIVGFSAVVGTYVPHYQDYENGRRVRRPLRPILDYYPAIVSKAQFVRAQASRKAAYTGGRSSVGFLLHNLARCTRCNQYMRIVRRAERGPSMVCVDAAAGIADHYEEIPYLPIDTALRQALPNVLRSLSHGNEGYGTNTRLITAQNGVDKARRLMSVEVRMRLKMPIFDTGKDRLDAAEEELRDAAENYESRPTISAIRKVATALECLSDPEVTLKNTLHINIALKAMFSSVQILASSSIIVMRDIGGLEHHITAGIGDANDFEPG